MMSDGERLFMYILAIYMSSLEISARIFCPFFNWIIGFWLLSRMSSLYIFDTKPLSDMSFANIFSHSVGCLLASLIISFAVQKLFILM